MNDKPEFGLLVDIAKLLKKYGPETFEGLAKNLSSPKFSERLVSILSATAKTGRTVGVKAKSEFSPRDFRTSLVELEKTEPDRSTLLLKLYDSLMVKSLLPTLRDIQTFVSDTGLPPFKATARSKAIVPFMKTLLNLPLDELKVKLSAIQSVSSQDNRSLEGWSNIILDKRRRTNQETK